MNEIDGEEWFLDTLAIPLTIILILLLPAIIMNILKILYGG